MLESAMPIRQHVRERGIAGSGELDGMTDRIFRDGQLAGQANERIDLLGLDSEGAGRNLGLHR
jgi:hypothetical protein